MDAPLLSNLISNLKTLEEIFSKVGRINPVTID